MPTGTIFRWLLMSPASTIPHPPAFRSRRPPPTLPQDPKPPTKLARRQKVALAKLSLTTTTSSSTTNSTPPTSLRKSGRHTTTARTHGQDPLRPPPTPRSLHPAPDLPPPIRYTQPRTCHVTRSDTTPDPRPEPSQQDSANTEQGQREGPATVKEGNRKAQRQEQVAGEVEAPQGKQPSPPTALAEHGEHGSKLGAHEIVHADAFAAGPHVNDMVGRVQSTLLPTPSSSLCAEPHNAR